MLENKIETFIVEEHNEAFYIWHHAINEGSMNKTQNCLVHIDEHSDMGTPRFNKSINSLNGNLTDYREFTKEETNIASFIMPAIYLDVFNDIYWIKQVHRSSKKVSREMYIKSLNDDGKKLISGKVCDIRESLEEFRKQSSTFKEFGYHLFSESQLLPMSNVVLDIDLDYFSCAGSPNQNREILIEITEAEFDEFSNDKYHRLYYLPLRIEARKIDGQFFYVLNYYNEVYPTPLKKSKEVINERIEKLIETLKQKIKQPQIITICRSRFSEYTPVDQWEYIEAELLKGLNSIYNLDVKHIEKV